MNMLLVTSIICHKLFIIYMFLDFICSKIVLNQKVFSEAAINLTTRGPLYTCLVVIVIAYNVIGKYICLV